jgi:hypothetical protein
MPSTNDGVAYPISAPFFWMSCKNASSDVDSVHKSAMVMFQYPGKVFAK